MTKGGAGVLPAPLSFDDPARRGLNSSRISQFERNDFRASENFAAFLVVRSCLPRRPGRKTLNLSDPVSENQICDRVTSWSGGPDVATERLAKRRNSRPHREPSSYSYPLRRLILAISSGVRGWPRNFPPGRQGQVQTCLARAAHSSPLSRVMLVKLCLSLSSRRSP